MTERLIFVKVGGATFDACLDPRLFDTPEAMGLPRPSLEQRGRARRYTYRISPEIAASLLRRLDAFAGTFLVADDMETRRDGERLKADADRLRLKLRVVTA